jgi:hypothetical protein
MKVLGFLRFFPDADIAFERSFAQFGARHLTAARSPSLMALL